jgi:hypothetical protein
MYKLANGQSLMKYCKANKIPYCCIWERVSLKGMKPDEALRDYLAKKGKPHNCRLYWKGLTFRTYCKRYKLPYQYIVDQMRYMDLTIEEIMTKYERIKDEKGY